MTDFTRTKEGGREGGPSTPSIRSLDLSISISTDSLSLSLSLSLSRQTPPPTDSLSLDLGKPLPPPTLFASATSSLPKPTDLISDAFLGSASKFPGSLSQMKMIGSAHFCALLIMFTGGFFSIVSPDKQGDALLLLRTSLNTTNQQLSDWNQTAETPCGWSGITCDQQNLVVEIRLPSMGLSGTLSPGIAILKNLQVLSLPKNVITSKIPEAYGNLTNLIELDLRSNHLIGEIPHSLGNLRELQSLFLNQNDLAGAIPDSLSYLLNLSVIFTGNQLNCGATFAHPCAYYSGHEGSSHKKKIAVILGVVCSVIGLPLLVFICFKKRVEIVLCCLFCYQDICCCQL